jgi:cell division protein FtsW (lipid II flippase)
MQARGNPFSTVLNILRYRWSEFFLLLLPSVFLILGMLQLTLIANNNNGKGPTVITPQNLPPFDSLGPQLLLIVALLGTHIVLTWLVPAADQIVLPLAGMLSAFGVLEATRLGPDLGVPSLGYRQLIWVILGLGFCIATVWATRSLRWVRLYRYTFAAIGIVLVAITLVHAHGVNFNSPTHDQLNLGPAGLSFQPSELLKICLVIFYASYLAENREMLADTRRYRIGPISLPPLRQLAPMIVLLILSLLMFVYLRELGLALLLFGVFVSMIYMASGRFSYVIYSLIAFAGGAYVAYELFGYVRDRVAIVTTAFNPSVEPNTGFQIVQGLIALGSGGIFGQGFGLGHPTFVPAVQTDFVAASIGEEFGMIGLFAVIALFMLLIYRGFRIAVRGRDTFEQLLAGGISCVFAIQTLVILAGNLKIIPLTGIPLPFITYGGSSVIANFIMIGLLLRLSAPEEA